MPVGSEQCFVDFLRSLRIDEKFINNKISSTVSNNTIKTVEVEESIEYFRTTNNPDVQLTENGRRCEMISQNKWHRVFGTQNYSTGIHRIRLKLEKGNTNILIGICSQIKPPTGTYCYDTPTTHGWFTHGYAVTNGYGYFPRWPQVNENDILQLTIDCDGRSLSILNERNQVQLSMQVDVNRVPFPWCLLVLLYFTNDRVSLV